jgi:hypothetical protein
MKKAKLTTADEDNVTIILQNKDYHEFQDSINNNVYYYDGDKSETQWCLIQYDNDGLIEWWPSQELELI